LISIIIPCHNEENVIIKKLENTLSVLKDQQAEIIVVDDGSTDSTVEKIKNWSNTHVKTRLLELPRVGKNTALNFGIQQSKHEIIVVTDANSQLKERAIKSLLLPFSNKNVGMVRGQYQPISSQNGLLIQGANIYQQNEAKRFTLESAAGVLHVSGGALQAFRRQLVDINEKRTLTEDWDLTLHIRSSGKLIIFQPDAVASKFVSNLPEEVYRQNVRLTYGSIQTIWKYRKILNPRKFGNLTIGFISGKVLQVLSPWFGLTFILAVIIKALISRNLFSVLICYIFGVILIITLALILLPTFRRLKNPFLAFFAYFVLVEFAAIVAWWKIISRQQINSWEPVQSIRNEII
jgi:cellulose synthase/poly-beta-1,6-N-acetylglucosamine synthase-like glycosyltransferase